jgi:uncharacterized membrane protein YiaA
VARGWLFGVVLYGGNPGDIAMINFILSLGLLMAVCLIVTGLICVGLWMLQFTETEKRVLDVKHWQSKKNL